MSRKGNEYTPRTWRDNGPAADVPLSYFMSYEARYGTKPRNYAPYPRKNRAKPRICQEYRTGPPATFSRYAPGPTGKNL